MSLGLYPYAPFGFIPKRLEMPDRPELSVFPYNVLFMSMKLQSGKKIIGTALYEPEVETYKETGNKMKMRYRNVYGGNNWLEITYEPERDYYVGRKYINGKQEGTGFALGWKMFFFYFTALGVIHGETCLLEEKLVEEAK